MFSDYDGTLTQNNRLYKENIEAIKYFQDNGGSFSLATGRSVNSFLDMPFNTDLPGILNNGAIIYDKNKKSYVLKNVLETDTTSLLKEIYSAFSNLKLMIADDEGNNYRYYKSTKPFANFTNDYFLDNELLKKLEGKILAVYLQDPNILFKDVVYYVEKYNCSPVREYPGYYAITKKGTSKGSALKYIKENLIEKTKKIIYVGDGDNDYEAVLEADYSFAVDGFSEKIKNAATYVIKDGQPSIPQVLKILNDIIINR